LLVVNDVIKTVMKCWEGLKKVVRILRNAFRAFVRTFKTTWAMHVVRNGAAHQRKRAMIFLQTRSKRIKRKQWIYISPF
jgi:hypothetical protein